MLKRWVMPAALLGAAIVGMALVMPAEAQSWRNVTMSRQLDGEREVDVSIRYGAGEFEITPGEAGTLYRMELRYDEETFDPIAEYDRGRLDLGVEGRGRRINIRKGDHAGHMQVQLARDLPMALTLEFGAVRAELDLGGLSLTDLELKTGAADAFIEISEPNPIRMRRASFHVGAAELVLEQLGNLNADEIEVDAGVADITLDFTGEWAGDAEITVDMALGAMELLFPRSVGVEIIKDTFLTAFDADEMVKRGGRYYSTNWESADIRLTVHVEAAFGAVDIRWVGRR